MKDCFVISPIGAEGTRLRKHADDVFKYIIKPATDECGLNAVRSDHLDKPGRISEQMLDHLAESDLCIAVLTGYNPNVFYELALAQSARRPVIILIERGRDLPFDVKDLRCVEYDLDIDSYESKTHIKKVVNHVREFEQDGWVVKDESLKRFHPTVVNYLKMDADVPDAFVRSTASARNYIQEAVLTWTMENYQSRRDAYRNDRDRRVLDRSLGLQQLVVIHHRQHFEEIVGMLARFEKHDRYELRYYEPAENPMPAMSLWSFDGQETYLGSFYIDSLPGVDSMLCVKDEQLSEWLSGYWQALWNKAGKLKEGLKIHKEPLKRMKDRLGITDDEYESIWSAAKAAANGGKWVSGRLVP
jgi:hypothetical protein